MTIDHIGLQLFPQYLIFRIIGRLAFPIFAYFIFEGSRYTKNKFNYFLQIFILGLIYTGGYYFYSKEIYGNIFVTFSLSLLVLYSVQLIKAKYMNEHKLSLKYIILLVLSIIFVQQICTLIKIDYGFYGVMLPVSAELFDLKLPNLNIKNNNSIFIGFSICLILLASRTNYTQYCSLLAVPILLLYNGRRGKLKMKYFFYWYYPLHLVIIALISYLI